MGRSEMCKNGNKDSQELKEMIQISFSPEYFRLCSCYNPNQISILLSSYQIKIKSKLIGVRNDTVN
jgi:hypothetical protein